MRQCAVLMVVLALTACAPQRYLDDNRNMATMPVDELVRELAK